MTNVILCGGSGTRLWPISRTLMPKQFIRLFDEKSLFQLTVERNANICDSQLVVSNAEQYFLAKDQLEELQESNAGYLLEPVGRNTAPAIALACMTLPKDEIVLVTPSDHLIKEEQAYGEVLHVAEKLAMDNHLVTFGIVPNYAETGFGYIEADCDNAEIGTNGFDVKAFHEKPDAQTAAGYLNEDRYYWNSGMFMFKAGVFLEELRQYAPEIYGTSKMAFENAAVDEMRRIKHEDMISIPENSIDYAVMEKSRKVKVVPSEIGWSDVGSFDALYAELPKDDNGNTVNENHIAVDSKNNLVYGSERQIATIDLEEMIVIDSGDALLVSKRGSSQKVKQVVQKLKDIGSSLSNIHRTAYRPWGTYTVLEDSPGYKIKRIVVKPGKRLSLQKHYHRNEHWIVVSGTATVTVGNETKIVRANESTYIKMGEVHRLANDGLLPVVLIEAQVGEYTGEDDIVRLDDDFKRG